MQSAATSPDSSKNVISFSKMDTLGLNPKNQPSHLETRHVVTWDLVGELEEAIPIPLRDTDRKVKYSFMDMSTKVTHSRELTIPSGYYYSPSQVCDYMTDHLLHMCRHSQFPMTNIRIDSI